MLRLWRDLYRIVLHPNQVSLIRVQKGRFSKAEAVSVVVEIPASTLLTWRAALAHLEEVIAGIRSARADIEIVLSNHFVRYAVIPWSSEVTNGAEAQVMARICFEEVYGDLAAAWELSLSAAGYGESRLASAVDRELIQALSDVFNRTSLRLVSIQPYLMTAFNHCRSKIQDDDCLLVLEEPGRLCLAQIRNRQWSQIRLSTIGNLAEELPGILNREVLLSGLNATVNKYRFALGYIQENLPLSDLQMLSFPAPNSQSDLLLRSA